VSAPPTIAIDARAAVEEGAGRGRVVRELLRTLARRDDALRYLLLARRRWPDLAADERFEWWLGDLPDPLWHVRATVEANRRADVIFATNSYLPAWFATRPVVTLVHDMLTFDRAMHPNKRSAVIERLTLGPAVRRSRALLVYTPDGEQQLVARFPRAAGRISLAPLAPSSEPPEAMRPEEEATLPPPGFVLAVGTLEPRKNLPRLVAAYQALPGELQAAHPLAVAGRLGWETDDTVRALHSLGERAHVLGYVSDAALLELYRRAAVFAYPSLGEGFGLPVLEAMAEGAPVVTSDVSSLPYVGGDAVAYCSPRDTASITAALERLLRDPAERARLGELGRRRAAGFSWDAFADVVLSACAAGT
jgi:glycosyltransferase involved in cell wall biosynthesis